MLSVQWRTQNKMKEGECCGAGGGWADPLSPWSEESSEEVTF